MLPKDGESNRPTGRLRLVWLRTLNNSPRTRMRRDSLHRNAFDTAMSTFTVPGPRRMLRPALPYAGDEGMAKAVVLNHSPIECGLLEDAAGEVRFGRQLFPWALTSAQFISTLNGEPVSARKIPLSCQPREAAVSSRGASPSEGISHTALATKRCARSKLESPRSSSGWR